MIPLSLHRNPLRENLAFPTHLASFPTRAEISLSRDFVEADLLARKSIA
jgi:hypothetical protein